MRKLLIGLTLLVSMSTFAGSETLTNELSRTAGKILDIANVDTRYKVNQDQLVVDGFVIASAEDGSAYKNELPVLCYVNDEIKVNHVYPYLSTDYQVGISYVVINSNQKIIERNLKMNKHSPVTYMKENHIIEEKIQLVARFNESLEELTKLGICRKRN